ncbi:zinc finger protein ZAT11-like [Solanum pennellii]|uniref:Zinc finger protein ZAT11-like n=1 Tax=Solanum pennellii TaxID=28526 RepID=A0ABM1GBV3_SOLPN|nr:zinc finger protein ZAT11-like [Solanum pennellii]
MDMTLKRSKVEEESVEKFAMANCADIMKRNELLERPNLIFKCKKCKKRFESFQALGGHMTSHKNKLNKLTTMSTAGELLHVNLQKHECSICGKNFAIGQALGGHMRKHRDELNQLEHKKKKMKLDESLIKSGRELAEALNSKSDELAEARHDKLDLEGSKRTLFLGLNLDLNLTIDENELRTG